MNILSFARIAVPSVGGGLQLTSLEASSHPFAQGVRAAASSLESTESASLEERILCSRRLQTVGFTSRLGMKSYGYLSTGLDYGVVDENLWVAAALRACTGTDGSLPVLVPFDDLFDLAVASDSLHMIYRWREIVRLAQASEGAKHVTLLVGHVGASSIFTRETVSRMPRGDRLAEQAEWRDGVEADVENFRHRIFRPWVREAGLWNAVFRLAERMPADDALLLSAYLVFSENESWQGAPHEGHTVLFAPTSFLTGMIRVNYALASRQGDFLGEREAYVWKLPEFDRVDGVWRDEETIHQRYREDIFEGGLEPSDFVKLVKDGLSFL